MKEKCIFPFVLSAISLWAFQFPANCSEVCAEGLLKKSNSLIKISQDIYLSEEGKLYQKTPCDIYITQEEINHYVSLKQRYNSISAFGRLTNINGWSGDVGNEKRNNINGWSGHVNSRTEVAPISKKIELLQSKILEMETLIPQIKNINIQELAAISNLEILQPKDSISNQLDVSERINRIEISPVYYQKFIELDREPTVRELLGIKRYLLGEIDSKLRKKYQPNYSLIENTDLQLKAEIVALNKEVTDSKWETLEITVIPVLGGLSQIDVGISAVLLTQSGLGDKVPERKTFKYSEDHKSLQTYVLKLITFLKHEIPISDFELTE